MSVAPREYPHREIYPSAPLEWVACEIRFPLAPALVQQPAIDAMSKAVRLDLPVLRPEEVQTMSLGPVQSSSVAERRFRFLDMKSTKSAIIAGSAVIIETTRYEEYDSFRVLVKKVLSSVQNITQVVGVERVGLRYVNEIRVPAQVSSVQDWQGWMADSIVQVLDIAEDLRPHTLETVLRLGSQVGYVTVRLASLTEGAIIGNDPLRRRSALHNGPLFVIDIDSYWERGDGDFLDFEVVSLLELMDDLHEPVGRVFQSTLTDKLRQEMRRNR